ncbi:voltage-gated chloride channel family protein [Streptococcus caballi]|uniref:voltage-gated chloride channel family protein n=1 Tax=Streptococcus caballi TaxID=439220 RepID=UPI000374CF64|nr:voltage-gated chloride channel family protein [Streptococcus caballi]
MNLKNIKESTRPSSLVYVQLVFSAILVGLAVGVVDTIFGRTLLWLGDVRSQYFPYLIPFLGLAGLVIVYLYQRFGGKASQGMGLVFKVGHEEDDEIPLRLIPLVTLTTWLTHLFGGSAGREGVAVQLGAALSHHLSRYIKVPNKSQIFLLTGMAAGFAGLFQTPIAAVFFALEVLVLGNLNLVALLPAVLASFVASWTSHALGLEKFSYLVSTYLTMDAVTFSKMAVLGLIFGLVGSLFASFLAYAKQKATLVKNPYYRILAGSLVLSAIFFLLFKGRYSGLGTNLIDAAFGGQPIFAYDWLFKLILTVLTLCLGFQGGEVTPLFATGASLGAFLAGYFGLPAELVAAAGYISVFGAATNTLLAPIFIGGEVFGFANTPYFFIAVVFAYLVNCRASIYAGQKIREN